MRVMSSRAHGVIDYLTGALLMASPWLFGFADGSAAQWLPVMVGATILLLSFLTDYELSITRLVPMPVHLGADFLSGLLLAASPWLFAFSHRVWLPHLLIGAFEVIVSFITRTTPEPEPGFQRTA